MQQTINKIQQSFSKSAPLYDSRSGLHRDIADKLLAQTALDYQPSRILDVGCGTGYLTVKAKKTFIKARVMGLDFAQGMLGVARQKHEDIRWVLGDIHQLPFPNNSIDLLISNLSYQWAEDLPKAFREAWRVLAPGKVFSATLFGFHTCGELFECLDEARPKQVKLNRLPYESQVTEFLRQAGFQQCAVKNEHSKLNFKDMYDLLNWVKAIGANNLLQEGYLGAQSLARAAAIYQERFASEKGVDATFEVIWIYAQK